MKFKHPITGQTNWMIITAYPSEPRNGTRYRTVYWTSDLGYFCYASGCVALLQPHFDERYQGGKIPLWFNVENFTNRKAMP